MSRLVVDASAALAWILPQQATARASAFSAELHRYDLIAPAIFEWEVFNILNLHRGRRISEARYQQALETLVAAQIAVTAPESPQRLTELAHAERLSLFDAAYLDLADAQGADVVSRDETLLTACAGRSVPIHDLRDSAET